MSTNEMAMNLSDEYITLVLTRGSESGVLSSSSDKPRFSRAFLQEARFHYEELVVRLAYLSSCYSEHHRRKTLLCEDVLHAIHHLPSKCLTSNTLLAPLVSQLYQAAGEDDDIDDEPFEEKNMSDNEDDDSGSDESFLESVYSDEDDDDDDDEIDIDDEVEGALISDDEAASQDERADALDQTSIELMRWELSYLDCARSEACRMSRRFDEEIIHWNGRDIPHLPKEFIEYFAECLLNVKTDTFISPAAYRLVYEYANDQVALSFEDPSSSVLRHFGMNLKSIYKAMCAEEAAKSNASEVPSVNELLAAEQSQMSGLLASLQNVYRTLVRDVLDHHEQTPSATGTGTGAGAGAGVAQSSSVPTSSRPQVDISRASEAGSDDKRLVQLLMKRCLAYEDKCAALEAERAAAQRRTAEVEQLLANVQQLIGTGTATRASTSQSSEALKRTPSFQSTESRQSAKRYRSDGATTCASGESAAMSSATALDLDLHSNIHESPSDDSVTSEKRRPRRRASDATRRPGFYATLSDRKSVPGFNEDL